ncbi:enamine deaminase RidA (YjgF/YER057c/UK114 family) [Deinobacterium chartae]|uniref:Enamine deaminase RidA (YjgF/YER057c/UK114 family) n=1 Tax=Deinobacterium chartae TaxID=521158 RepID=A0A841I6G5_9DEIO|nr:RidA family protein [Deinobacterium chartae]MBB6099435.1 enamine deaminase RidA (YjgF/YER057c/UK114 family) [Deinobacterium chartae]
MSRQNYTAGTRWESEIGCSRAVRVGAQVFVSGCTALKPDGSMADADDVYLQAQQALRNLETGLREVGASLADVVRTRMFLTNIDHWPKVARAHLEAFGDVRPAASMLEVSSLIDSRMLVEIEADALVFA